MLCVDAIIPLSEILQELPADRLSSPTPSLHSQSHCLAPASLRDFKCTFTLPMLSSQTFYPNDSLYPFIGPSCPPRCLPDNLFCSTPFPSSFTDLHTIFIPLPMCLWSILPAGCQLAPRGRQFPLHHTQLSLLGHPLRVAGHSTASPLRKSFFFHHAVKPKFVLLCGLRLAYCSKKEGSKPTTW